MTAWVLVVMVVTARLQLWLLNAVTAGWRRRFVAVFLRRDSYWTGDEVNPFRAGSAHVGKYGWMVGHDMMTHEHEI
ncbi:hypothetical protein BaRGS_00015753 [Batillaria attramentaria]|uniref:Secreted protein n=1 Tax=Batillaria attramentaria TaxID=370345 RepID=A0ABD0L1E1_9CAEN